MAVPSPCSVCPNVASSESSPTTFHSLFLYLTFSLCTFLAALSGSRSWSVAEVTTPLYWGNLVCCDQTTLEPNTAGTQEEKNGGVLVCPRPTSGRGPCFEQPGYGVSNIPAKTEEEELRAEGETEAQRGGSRKK